MGPNSARRRVGCSGSGVLQPTSPAVRVAPSLLAISVITLVGCDGSASAPAVAAGSATADPAAAATALIARECSRCHARSSIQGRTAADIREAIRKNPGMAKFQDQLTAEQLRALEQALAAEPAGD